MTDKETLVELLAESEILCEDCGPHGSSYCIEAIADHLIANGVTIQEWIPVEERLPEPTVNVLACYAGGEIVIDAWYRTFGHFLMEILMESDDHRVTHWMPLPPAPKGE